MTDAELKSRLHEALAKNGLQPKAEQLVSLGKPAVWVSLERVPDRRITIGQSKVGGRADLPREMPWPLRESGQPLQFIAQFDCAQVRTVQPALAHFPERGLLSFFYDNIGAQFGLEPGERDGSRVIYSPSGTKLKRKATPRVRRRSSGDEREQTAGSCVLASCSAALQPTLTWPDWGALELESILDGDGRHRYADALHELDHSPEDSSGCQIGGHASCIQNEMRDECALVHAGFDTGSEWPRGTQPGQASATSLNWNLLMQIGSAWDQEDKHGVMWGDAGAVYFWSCSDSMEDRSFRNQVAIMQCS